MNILVAWLIVASLLGGSSYLINYNLKNFDVTQIQPKFKVNDCIADKDRESWEKGEIYLILNVGKKKYLYGWFSEFGHFVTMSWSIELEDEDSEKVECTPELKRIINGTVD